MSLRRPSACLVTAFAVCLLLTGCDQRDDNTDTGAPGAPVDRGGDDEGAPSPGRIPSISERGLPLDSEPYVREKIKDAFRKECGNGQVCVELVDRPSTDPADADATVCEYLRLEGEGERFEPDDKIVIVTGPKPCDSSETEGGGEESAAPVESPVPETTS